MAQNTNKIITAEKNTFENTNEYTQIDENMSIKNGNKIQKWYKGHETTVHEKENPVKCDFCETSFGLKSHLNSHQSTVHENKHTNEYNQIDEIMSINNGNKIQKKCDNHKTTVHENETNEYNQIDEIMSINNGNKIQLWCDIHEATTHSTDYCYLNKLRKKWCDIHEATTHFTDNCYSNKLRVPDNKNQQTMDKQTNWCDIHNTTTHSTDYCFSNTLRIKSPNENNSKKRVQATTTSKN